MGTLEYPILKNVVTGQIIEVSKSPFNIGRSLASDYVIEDNTISRMHCSIVRSDRGWVLIDSSMNGTVVNEDIYNGTTSCVLKNNDEICLSFYEYTYKFLIESIGAPNHPQVEMLRSEGSVTPDVMSAISPASYNSFDDNGVSDDVLNNLADNILSNIDEALEQPQSGGPSTKQCNEPNYEFNNILDPVELMLQPSQLCADANQQVKRCGNLEENSSEKSILRDLLYENSNNSAGVTLHQSNLNPVNAEELPSSGSTVIYYASPGSTNFNCPPTEVDQNVAESSVNNNYIPLALESSISKAVPEVNKSTIHNSVERFKAHFDQTLDEVVRKYTVPDVVTSSTSNNPSVAIVSPSNVNKKVKVTAASAAPKLVTTIINRVIVSEANRNVSAASSDGGLTISTSTNVLRPVYSPNFRFSLTQPPQGTSRISLIPCTVVVPEQTRRVVPKNTTPATNVNFVHLTNSQYYLTSTAASGPSTSVSIGSTATGSVPSVTKLVPANRGPVSNEFSGGNVAAAPSSKFHNSQEPSTSKQADKGAPSQLQTVVQNQYEEMEDELMCTICANLFIKAVTLGCSHSFCQYCIEAWKKKKSDCPICRNRITSSIRTLVLDNIIEKMLENAPLDDRKQRKEAIEERQKIEEAEKAAKNKQNMNRRGRNTARRGRRHVRNNDNVRAAPQPPPQPQPQPAQVIQILDTDNDTTDSDENDYGYDYEYDNYYDDEWYNGVEGAYFGGYGRCYICGNQGHWANGCPYR